MTKESLISQHLQEHSELKAKFVYEEDLADMLDEYAEEKVNDVLDKAIRKIGNMDGGTGLVQQFNSPLQGLSNSSFRRRVIQELASLKILKEQDNE